MAVCRRCGVDIGTDRRAGYCETCRPLRRAEMLAAWVSRTKEQKSRKDREYRVKNAERLKSVRQDYYQRNSSRIIAQSRSTFVRNREHIRVRAKDSYRMNAERIKSKRHADRDRIRKVERLYWANNPDKRRAKNQARRALKSGVLSDPIGVMAAVYVFLRETPRLRCYWCRKLVAIGRRHIDHIVPLAAGGTHTAANLCCSCVTCNLKKGSKLPLEFAGQGELAL